MRINAIKRISFFILASTGLRIKLHSLTGNKVVVFLLISHKSKMYKQYGCLSVKGLTRYKYIFANLTAYLYILWLPVSSNLQNMFNETELTWSGTVTQVTNCLLSASYFVCGRNKWPMIKNKRQCYIDWLELFHQKRNRRFRSPVHCFAIVISTQSSFSALI